MGSFGIRSILAAPFVYRAFNNLVSRNTHATITSHYIRPQPHDRMLDIGCGPGDMFAYLGGVEYVGFDMDENYIEAAKKRYGERATFFCNRVSEATTKDMAAFDLGLAFGVVHHDEAGELFKLARSVLRPGGRLITIDGCYVDKQSQIARFILSKDRGQFVRTEEEYRRIASTIFDDVRVSIRHDLLRMPYIHIIMECTA